MGPFLLQGMSFPYLNTLITISIWILEKYKEASPIRRKDRLAVNARRCTGCGVYQLKAMALEIVNFDKVELLIRKIVR
jgi:hypothetical protein